MAMLPIFCIGFVVGFFIGYMCGRYVDGAYREDTASQLELQLQKKTIAQLKHEIDALEIANNKLREELKNRSIK